MKEFTIDPEYFTDVQVYRKWNTYTQNGRKPTKEELVKILKGEGNCRISSSQDHPEFTKLREQLGEEGLIRIQRGWSNGDRVIKPFKLNGLIFSKGSQFSCAAAMGGQWKYMQSNPKYHKKGYWS